MLDNLVNWLAGAVSSTIVFIGAVLGGSSVDSVELPVATTTQPMLSEASAPTDSVSEEIGAVSKSDTQISLPKDEQLRVLKNQLRNASIIGHKRPDPRWICDAGSKKVTKGGVDGELELLNGLKFSFSLSDNTTKHKALELYATDADGGVAGHITYPELEGRIVFDSLSEYWDASAYGALSELSLDEYIDGEIRVRNIDLETHFFSFYVSDRWGDCYLTNQIMIGVSTSTTVTIPVSKSGQVGPMEWDYESDGVVDMYESLFYENSEEQTWLNQEIFALTQPDKVVDQCKEISAIDISPEETGYLSWINVIKRWCSEKGI